MTRISLIALSIEPRMVVHHEKGVGDKAIFVEAQNGWLVHLSNNTCLVLADEPKFPLILTIEAPNAQTD